MSTRITPGQIKKNNRQQIYNYIYSRGKVSQQDISYALHLSRPTVTANLTALEEDGLISRQQFNEIPPHVEYSLTDMGRDLLPVFYAIMNWGFRHEQELYGGK